MHGHRVETRVLSAGETALIVDGVRIETVPTTRAHFHFMSTYDHHVEINGRVFMLSDMVAKAQAVKAETVVPAVSTPTTEGEAGKEKKKRKKARKAPAPAQRNRGKNVTMIQMN
jgi:hypothetical protein